MVRTGSSALQVGLSECAMLLRAQRTWPAPLPQAAQQTAENAEHMRDSGVRQPHTAVAAKSCSSCKKDAIERTSGLEKRLRDVEAVRDGCGGRLKGRQQRRADVQLQGIDPRHKFETQSIREDAALPADSRSQ